MTVKNIINFENIYVNYGMTTVLENINLKINNDENWVILGEMSTGEQRRCIIGRSLIHNPKAVILITHSIEEIFPDVTHVALIYNKTIYKQGRKNDILTSENLSEIFEADIELQKAKDRYFIKIR